jgi:hypothetical protein
MTADEESLITTSSETRQEAMMPTEIHAEATLPQRAVHEFREFAILTLYLYITLGAVIVMKTAVLHTEGIEFAPWGVAIVKALLLAVLSELGRQSDRLDAGVVQLSQQGCDQRALPRAAHSSGEPPAELRRAGSSVRKHVGRSSWLR